MNNPIFVKILVDCDESEIIEQFANGRYVVIPSKDILLITQEDTATTTEGLKPQIQAIREKLNRVEKFCSKYGEICSDVCPEYPACRS